MREEYNSVLSTTTATDNIGRFDRYIGKTRISADISARLIYRSICNFKTSFLGLAKRCDQKFGVCEVEELLNLTFISTLVFLQCSMLFLNLQ